MKNKDFSTLKKCAIIVMMFKKKTFHLIFLCMAFLLTTLYTSAEQLEHLFAGRQSTTTEAQISAVTGTGPQFFENHDSSPLQNFMRLYRRLPPSAFFPEKFSILPLIFVRIVTTGNFFVLSDNKFLRKILFDSSCF